MFRGGHSSSFKVLAKSLGIGALASIPLTLPLVEIQLNITGIVEGLAKALVIGALTGFLTGVLLRNLKSVCVSVVLSIVLSIFLGGLTTTYIIMGLFPELPLSSVYYYALMSIVFGSNFLIAPVTILTYLIFSLIGAIIREE